MEKRSREVRQKVEKIKDEKKKISAIYTQLQLHHIVLDSGAPKNYYFQRSYSQKGRKVEFSSSDMTANLIEVLKLNLTYC